MSRGDTGHDSIADEDSARSGETGDGDRGASGLASRVRKHAQSGTLAGVLGGAAVLRGVRSLRAGERARGLGRLAVGGGLLAVAAAQRRVRREPSGERIDIDQSDVVDTAPDIDAVGSSSEEGDRAGGEAASEVVDTGPDIGDATESDEAGSDGAGAEVDEGNGTGTGGGDAGGTADEASAEGSEGAPGDSEGAGDTGAADAGAIDTGAGGTAEAGSGAAPEAGSEAGAEPTAFDRLGEAAFDEHSNEVPVPQQAFNRGFLALGEEAHWGVRDDGSVVVSERFDPVQGGDGVDYVASTTVDDDRTLTVPDEVTDHWNAAVGGPMAVESGDGVVFATSDDLATDRQLLVVPAAWADDALGEGT
ncbi:hypothetical protein [Halosimplex halophilum]|uniref:hypothetical protein n=1 Tax=Halosimplex halophilum TaxID=2559572 RepID=UPI00107F0E5D|nr:hypothetical protein [Halosimplex halophilum]